MIRLARCHLAGPCPAALTLREVRRRSATIHGNAGTPKRGKFMTEIGRRTVLQTGAALLGAAAMAPEAASAQATQSQGAKASGKYEFLVKDMVYQPSSGGKERLARLYQPKGDGPFPAILQVH